MVCPSSTIPRMRRGRAVAEEAARVAQGMMTRGEFARMRQAEWWRRREQLIRDLAEAKEHGDFTAYRALRERWRRFYSKGVSGPPAAT